MVEHVIRLSRSEAWDKGLPPIAFSVDMTGTALSPKKFPEPECYLRLAREPGKSLNFKVSSYKSEKHDERILKKIIRRAFYNSRYIPVRMKGKTTIRLDGIERVAREFTTSRSANKMRWLAALVPSPDGGPYGLLVAFGYHIGARKNKLDSVLDHPVHASLAQGFELASQ
jgi:hypothetical protein